MTWNQELAGGAQTWDEDIASRGVMEHANLGESAVIMHAQFALDIGLQLVHTFL